MLRISQFSVCSGASCDDVEQPDDEQRPDRHLDGAGAADELEELVDQERDDRDVEQIPPADGRAGRSRLVEIVRHRGGSLSDGGLVARYASSTRMRSATRTTSTISRTPCTRTMCAPRSTRAATAAAVPHSRSDGSAAPPSAASETTCATARQDRTIERRQARRAAPALRSVCSACFAKPSPGSRMIGLARRRRPPTARADRAAQLARRLRRTTSS